MVLADPPAWMREMRKFWKAVPLLAVLIIACLALYRFGGIGGFVAYSRGEDVVVSKISNPKNSGPDIEIFNPTFEPIEVLSCSTTCNCVAISGLPHRVDAGHWWVPFCCDLQRNGM